MFTSIYSFTLYTHILLKTIKWGKVPWNPFWTLLLPLTPPLRLEKAPLLKKFKCSEMKNNDTAAVLFVLMKACIKPSDTFCLRMIACIILYAFFCSPLFRKLRWSQSLLKPICIQMNILVYADLQRNLYFLQVQTHPRTD